MAYLKANYHTHNQLCNHAIGKIEDYIKEAIKLGFKELGLSDHGPIPTSFMTCDEYISNLCYRNMSYEVYKNIYLKKCYELKEKYKDQIKIYVGLETEFLKEQINYYKSLRNELDYLVLGVHYIKYEGKILNTFADINYKNIFEYVNTAITAMETGLFTIFAHPDLFMFNYHNINGERKFDDAAKKATHMLIDAAIKNDCYLELNCNGLANSRKYLSSTWLYPYYEFWQIVKEYENVKIIIGADAHNPLNLDNQDIKDVIDFKNKLGLKSVDYVIMKENKHNV